METKQTTQKKNKYYKTLKLVFGLKITTGHQTVTKVETQKFQHGSSEVPAKVQERSRKFPRARFQHKSDKVPRKVPARFQHRFQEGSKWFQEGSSTVPAIFQQRSSKVPARLRARFQQGSRAVPVFPVFPGVHFRVTTPRPQRLKPNRFAVGD